MAYLEINDAGCNPSTTVPWVTTLSDTSDPSAVCPAQLTRVLEARQAEHACDICRQEQVLVEATAWCRTCLEAMCTDCHRVHTRSRASRDHALISMDSLVNEPLEKLVGPGSAGRSGVQCGEHRGKTATLLCVDCKRLACETCIALNHPACRRIEQADKVGADCRVMVIIVVVVHLLLVLLLVVVVVVVVVVEQVMVTLAKSGAMTVVVVFERKGRG